MPKYFFCFFYVANQKKMIYFELLIFKAVFDKLPDDNIELGYEICTLV